MITVKFPLLRSPTSEEWQTVWGITGLPPNTRPVKGAWRIKVSEERYAELLTYLRALALDMGFAYSPEIDGWVGWPGGECPELSPVDYKTRSGHLVTSTRAGDVRWSHDGGGGDVIAYRKSRP